MKDLQTETIKQGWKKLKIIQNKKIFYAHGLEDLILLKSTYFPKQSTDLIQSLQKFQ